MMRKEMLWKAASFVIALLVVIGLVVARQRYLSRALTDEEIIEVKRYAGKRAGSMSLRALQADSFINLTRQGMSYYYWELNSAEHDLYGRYYEIPMAPTTHFDTDGQMRKLVNTMWEADTSTIQRISERLYTEGGLKRLDGQYIVGIHEQRVRMVCRETKGRVMLLVTLGPPYAQATQDTMINSVEFGVQD